MRLHISDLLEALDRTALNVAIPIVARSGDMQALWEMAAGSRIMTYVRKRWKDEYGRLMRENMRMEDLLREAAEALAAAGGEQARQIEAIRSRCRCEPALLPAIDELARMSEDLKSGLEIFIIAHAGIGAADTPQLRAARRRVRGFLKETVERDFAAAQDVIFF